MKKYVLVHVEGITDSPDELADFIDDLQLEAESISLDKILIDHRNLKFERENVGTFDLAVKCLEKLNTVRKFKVALVSRPERMRFARIYETVGLTIGLKIKAFDKYKMASVWLNS